MSNSQTADPAIPVWLAGQHAGQEAYAQFKGPEPPYGSNEWRQGYMRGWMFAALNDQGITNAE